MEQPKPSLKVGDQYDIPEEGSLGLMALGYKGLMMWRSRILGKQHDGKEIIGPIIRGENIKIYATGTKESDEEK